MSEVTIKSWAAEKAGAVLTPHTRTETLKEDEVLIKVLESSICHSDVHIVDNDWGFMQYPVIPGHEIIGVVTKVGEKVEDLKEGQRVGVGWISRACNNCEYCKVGEEQHCGSQTAIACGLSGGFADQIIVEHKLAVPVPDALPSAEAAPLLCAGITVFAPLSRYQKPGARVGIIGIGGLGHLALQFAKSLGYHVTAISRGTSKKDDAHKFGAHAYLDSTDKDALKKASATLDLVLNTTSAALEWMTYFKLIRRKGTFVFLGAAGEVTVPSSFLLMRSINVTASNVGSAIEIAKMFDIAARDKITAQIQTFDGTDEAAVNEALTCTRSGKVRFRSVLHFSNL